MSLLPMAVGGATAELFVAVVNVTTAADPQPAFQAFLDGSR